MGSKSTKIRMSFGTVKTVIIAVVLAGALAVIGLDIAMLAGANGIYLGSPAIPAVSLVAAIVVGLAAVLILSNSYYKFKEKGLAVMLGFFADSVRYEDIDLLRQDIETKELYVISSESKSGESMALKVNVATQNVEAFIKGLREYLPTITIELFPHPEKKKSDKQE